MNKNLALFRNQGFLVLEGFNSTEACEELMKRGESLVNGFDPMGHPSVFQTSNQSETTDDYFLSSGDKIRFFFEKDAFDEQGNARQSLFHSLNKIGHALHDLDPVFNHFSRSPQLKKLAHELELDDWVIIQSMLIFKHARIGGHVDVHQDSTFLLTEPDSCIGFWFALEDATIENGCLWAKPGGHATPLHATFRRKPGGGTEMQTLTEENYDMKGMVPLEVKQGTCIVLHGLLPHYSLPNTSEKSRQAYAIHTINRHAHYPETNWLQREMNKVRGF